MNLFTGHYVMNVSNIFTLRERSVTLGVDVGKASRGRKGRGGLSSFDINEPGGSNKVLVRCVVQVPALEKSFPKIVYYIRL